jgi:cytidylate kinase
MIVTIDGPAGSGKSTAARGLAARLGFQFLDTGAMYRVVAHACLAQGTDIEDRPTVAEAARQLEISFREGRILADGTDVTELIRTPEVTRGASVVASNPGVRKVLDALQRKLAKGQNVVTEGRDQGTVVFPDAECKFYLTADPRERACRRQQEMQQEGASQPFEKILAEIRERDERDRTRSVAPLKRADDAIVVDTSAMTGAEVVDLLEARVRERMMGDDFTTETRRHGEEDAE